MRRPNSRLTGSLELQLLRKTPSGWEAAKADDSGVTSFREGEILAVEILHRAETGLFVYLLDFGLTDRVTQLFPGEGGTEYLYPDLPLRLGTSSFDEQILTFPEACLESQSTGFLKVFATTRPVDLSWLCTDHPWPIRRRLSGRLESLLAMQGSSVPHRGEEDWVIRCQPLRVQRQKREKPRPG